MSDQFSEGLPRQSDTPPENVPNRSDAFSEDVPRKTDPPQRWEDGEDEPAYRLRALPHVTTEDRLIGVLVHWGGALSWVLAPFIIYLIQRDRKSLAAWHAREAFNFQLSTTIYYLLPLPLTCVIFIDFELWPLAVALPALGEVAVLLFEVVVIILASIAAYQGKFFRIPLNIPFIPRPKLSFDADHHADFD